MAKDFKMSPDEVRNAGTQFKQGSVDSENMVKKLNAVMEQLKANSSGVTSEEIYVKFQDWKKSMMQHVALLADIDTTLHRVADQVQQFDEKKKIV